MTDGPTAKQISTITRESRENFFSPLLFRLIRKERKNGKGTKKKHLGSSALSDLGFPLFSSSFA